MRAAQQFRKNDRHGLARAFVLHNDRIVDPYKAFIIVSKSSCKQPKILIEVLNSWSYANLPLVHDKWFNMLKVARFFVFPRNRFPLSAFHCREIEDTAVFFVCFDFFSPYRCGLNVSFCKVNHLFRDFN